MKITPVGAQNAQTASTGMSAKEKAVAAFNNPAKVAAVKAALSGNPITAPAPSQGNAQAEAVANPNHVSPEEMSAVLPPTEVVATTEESDTTAPIEDTDIREQAQVDPETERRFQQIAKQERVLRAKITQANTELKQREADLKAKEAELEAKYKPQDLSEYVHKSRIKDEADLVLDEAGVDWNELTNRVINRQPTDPRVMHTISKLEAEIQRLNAAVEDNKKSVNEQQTQSYQAAIKQIKRDVTSLVQENPDTYEAISAHDAVEDVVALIEKVYQKDGIILSKEEAAKEVEEYLLEEALRISDLKKVQARRQALNASKKTAETKTQTQQQPQTKTLTNAVGSQRPLTARERAIAAMEGRKS